MKKRNIIIYWVATIWLSLGMASTGLVQLLGVEEEVQSMERLGYPAHLLTLLGILKILGTIAILIPGFGLLKEWAYAGFFFAMTGALCAHIAAGDGTEWLFGPVLLIVLTVVSWYFRPAGRKPYTPHTNQPKTATT